MEAFIDALTNMYTQSHKTPAIMQREARECGAACLAMIFAYWGRPLSLDLLCYETNVSPDGLTAGDMMRAAKRLGFDCHGYRRDTEGLLNMPMPCVLHWNYCHFLVLEDIRNGIVYLNDPATGHKEITMEVLNKHYTGVVLTFRPMDSM